MSRKDFKIWSLNSVMAVQELKHAVPLQCSVRKRMLNSWFEDQKRINFVRFEFLTAMTINNTAF
jgi:hypothetical protein